MVILRNHIFVFKIREPDTVQLLLLATDGSPTFYNLDYKFEKQFSEYISVNVCHPKGIM